MQVKTRCKIHALDGSEQKKGATACKFACTRLLGVAHDGRSGDHTRHATIQNFGLLCTMDDLVYAPDGSVIHIGLSGDYQRLNEAHN